MSWGQPPGGPPPGGPPPGAGGFGAPPGGPPTPAFGGFGASPPAGGGPVGPPASPDGGLAQVPFSQGDLGNIKTMSTLMIAAAGLMVSGQVLGIVASIAWAIAGFGSNQGSSGSGSIGGGMVGLSLMVVMAALLVLGAQAFRKVVDTDDADQKHLEVGLGHLRSYFVVKGVVYLLSILLGCCVCAGSILFFGAIVALIGAVVGAQ